MRETKQLDKASAERIQKEARIANDLQRNHPRDNKTEALRIAKEIMDRQRVLY